MTEPATAATERALIENLAPGHMTPQDFYDHHCKALAERSGRDANSVARGYALGNSTSTQAGVGVTVYEQV